MRPLLTTSPKAKSGLKLLPRQLLLVLAVRSTKYVCTIYVRTVNYCNCSFPFLLCRADCCAIAFKAYPPAFLGFPHLRLAVPRFCHLRSLGRNLVVEKGEDNRENDEAV